MGAPAVPVVLSNLSSEADTAGWHNWCGDILAPEKLAPYNLAPEKLAPYNLAQWTIWLPGLPGLPGLLGLLSLPVLPGLPDLAGLVFTKSNTASGNKLKKMWK